MVRIRQAKGGWKELDVPGSTAEPFTRTNGVRMTEAEISAIAKGQPVDFGRESIAGAKQAPRPKRTADEYWNAVKRLGTQTAVAKEFGVSQGAVQSSLKTHMRLNGIEGPQPGLQTPAQVKQVAQARAAKITAERAAAHPAHVDEPAAAEPETIPLPQQIADDDSDAPVADDVPDPVRAAMDNMAKTVRKQVDRLYPGPATPAVPPLADLLEQVEANIVGREALLELLAPLDMELSAQQTALVLSAVIPGTMSRDSLTVARDAITKLKAHGFELIVRPLA